MTWSKAAPVLITAAITDAMRAFFALFFITGPILIGVATNAAASQYVGTFLGKYIGAALGTAVLLTTGAGLEVFGIIMAMCIGLLGWLVSVLLLLLGGVSLMQSRMFFLSLMSLIGSEAPIVNAAPFLTPSVFFMVRGQINEDAERNKQHQAAPQEAAQTA